MAKRRHIRDTPTRPDYSKSDRQAYNQTTKRRDLQGPALNAFPNVSGPEASQVVTFSQDPHYSESTPDDPAMSFLPQKNVVSLTTPPKVDEPPPNQRKPSLPIRILRHWLFWMTIAIAITGGVGGFAGATLFKLPSLPNCPNIFWPTASASLRMQCAELAASKNTTKDLLSAIELVDELPNSHPMRWQVDELIERWALDILDLADISFHNGDLDGAIASANRIPSNLAAYEQVNIRVDRWRSIWAKAERIYQESETFLESEDLRGAFAVAVKLLNVGNEYWETTQYEALTDLIETSRIDTEKLNEARRLAKAGGVSALLDAIHLVEEVQPKSRLYPPARRELGRFLESLVDLGIDALDRGDSDVAMKVARNLPSGVEFQAKAQDLRTLSFALSQASSGTVSDIEAAIVQAQDIHGDRPLYQKAQQMVSSWELEIQDVRQLARARELASLGRIPDLQAAIAEAKLVGRNNPRHGEAQTAIRQWTQQVQTLEDQPYLRNARSLAQRGDLRSLNAAIENAQRISEGRPLHSEASRLVRNWTQQVETIQDQPYLDDATRFAAQGNLPAAIAAAQQVGAGRSLYQEAQGNIQGWQDQINGDIFLQEAYDAARRGTPSAWARAIRTADRISSNHENRAEANRLINRWSQNILLQAQQTASVNYSEAIAIARMIPQRTEAYAAAQLQIETWQRAIEQPEPWVIPNSQPVIQPNRQPIPQSNNQPIIPATHSNGDRESLENSSVEEPRIEELPLIVPEG